VSRYPTLAIFADEAMTDPCDVFPLLSSKIGGDSRPLNNWLPTIFGRAELGASLSGGEPVDVAIIRPVGRTEHVVFVERIDFEVVGDAFEGFTFALPVAVWPGGRGPHIVRVFAGDIVVEAPIWIGGDSFDLGRYDRRYD
jgi:hypothetical protein